MSILFAVAVIIIGGVFSAILDFKDIIKEPAIYFCLGGLVMLLALSPFLVF